MPRPALCSLQIYLQGDGKVRISLVVEVGARAACVFSDYIWYVDAPHSVLFAAQILESGDLLDIELRDKILLAVSLIPFRSMPLSTLQFAKILTMPASLLSYLVNHCD